MIGYGVVIGVIVNCTSIIHSHKKVVNEDVLNERGNSLLHHHHPITPFITKFYSLQPVC